MATEIPAPPGDPWRPSLIRVARGKLPPIMVDVRGRAPAQKTTQILPPRATAWNPNRRDPVVGVGMGKDGFEALRIWKRSGSFACRWQSSACSRKWRPPRSLGNSSACRHHRPRFQDEVGLSGRSGLAASAELFRRRASGAALPETALNIVDHHLLELGGDGGAAQGDSFLAIDEHRRRRLLAGARQ